MAERRMIHRKISWSRQFNEMSEFAQLLFLMMIPHADDWGSMVGDAYVIKAQVIPMSSRNSEEDVESALNEMEEHRLFWRYQPNDEKPLLQFRKWEDHQTGLHKRTKPKNKLYFYCEEAREKLEEKGVSWNYQEFQGTSPRTKEGKELEQNEEGTEQPPTETRQRKDLLKHWAMKCYHHVVHRQMKGVLRESWAAFADETYTQRDEEERFKEMKADLKKFVAMGYFDGNVDWFMKWVGKGKPEKGGNRGPHKQRSTGAAQHPHPELQKKLEELSK